MMKGSQDMVIIMAATIVVGIMGIMIASRLLNPLLMEETVTEKAALKTALYIDSMSGVDSGKMEYVLDTAIPMEVSIDYNEKSHAWFATASSKRFKEEINSSMAIRSYPEAYIDDLRTTIRGERRLCIIKESMKLPRLTRC